MLRKFELLEMSLHVGFSFRFFECKNCEIIEYEPASSMGSGVSGPS